MATLTRWDPFRDLVSLQGELNRLFGRAYEERIEVPKVEAAKPKKITVKAAA